MMLAKETKNFFEALKFPVYLLLVLWSVHIIKVSLKLNLGAYGVYPRATDGLKGILFSPLIHGDYTHLISNSIPLFILTFFIFLFYKRVATMSFFLIYILTGFAVWLFARPVYHIGASGVVYGLVAFVFWSGIFRRNIKSIILALIVTLLYSQYFLGVLPNQKGISWESHLIGGFVGILISFIFRGVIEKDEEKKPDVWVEEGDGEDKYYLDRDVFDKTKWDQIQDKKGRFY